MIYTHKYTHAVSMIYEINYIRILLATLARVGVTILLQGPATKVRGPESGWRGPWSRVQVTMVQNPWFMGLLPVEAKGKVLISLSLATNSAKACTITQINVDNLILLSLARRSCQYICM